MIYGSWSDGRMSGSVWYMLGRVSVDDLPPPRMCAPRVSAVTHGCGRVAAFPTLSRLR